VTPATSRNWLASAATARSSSDFTAATAQALSCSMDEVWEMSRRTGANAQTPTFGRPNGVFPYNEGSSWPL
jgi:hypothetical protein